MKAPMIGSVSHGTMRPEDLIPTFIDTLRELDPARADQFAIEWQESRQADRDAILEELFDALNDHAPAYFYFGAHPGDGSDYGFWLGEFAMEDFDGLKVSDTSEVPDDYQGEVMHVNDHGNATLYVADGKGNLAEVWSLV